MLKKLISVEDWSGANTLNKKMGKANMSFRSFGLDLVTRPGFILPKQAYLNVTGGTASTDVSDVVYAITDGNTYIAIGNQLFNPTSSIAISSVHTSSVSETIQTLKEYLGKLYYAHTTKLGQYDLSSSYNDTFKSLSGSHHPIEISADGFMYVGEANTLSRWDGTTYSTSVLDYPVGWDTICLSNFGVTYLAIGINFVGAAGSTQCKILLWDRISTSWNDEIEVPEQTIYAMQYYKGGMWIWAGTTNVSIYYCPLGSRVASKIFMFENNIPNTYIPYVAVNAVTIRNGRVFFGYSCNVSASDESIPAIYSFNPDPKNFQLQGEFLQNDISETGSDDVLITCVRNVPSSSNPIIFIGQHHATTYTLNRLTDSLTDPYLNSTGYTHLETLYFEAPAGFKLYFDGFGIDTLPRPAGTWTLEYMADGDITWTQIFAYTATNGFGNYAQFAKECFQIKFRLTLTGNSTKVIWPLRRFYGTGKLVEDSR